MLQLGDSSVVGPEPTVGETLAQGVCRIVSGVIACGAQNDCERPRSPNELAHLRAVQRCC